MTIWDIKDIRKVHPDFYQVEEDGSDRNIGLAAFDDYADASLGESYSTVKEVIYARSALVRALDTERMIDNEIKSWRP